ncbi:MAG: DUF2934 domain-containing protein [Thiogranum sp.]|nr:DUF2934 domain-containing protein [Thiogranum sp.]
MVKEKVKAKAKAAATAESPAAKTVTEDSRTNTKPHGEKIAEAAYYKAQKRNFAPGFDLQDWLEAEHEIGEHAGR